MRLFHPSVGECADRSTILELKIEHGRKKGMDVKHFEDEAEEIDNYLQTPEFETTVETKDSYYRMRRELLSVNLRLWHLEDDVRTTPANGFVNMQKLALLCKDIARLNDERAGLVKSMNALYGSTTEEKIYVHSATT